MTTRRQFLGNLGAGFAATAGGVLLPQSARAQWGDGSAPSRYMPFSKVVRAESYLHPDATLNTDPVGFLVMIGLDESGSINSANGEYAAQKEAAAAAIEHPDFRDTIFSSPDENLRSVAICVMSYDESSYLNIGWMDFREHDADRFRSFANNIRNIERHSTGGGTEHAPLLAHAAIAMRECPWEYRRGILNVATDGTSTKRNELRTLRELLAIDYKTTVNSLITETNAFSFTNSSFARDHLRTQPNPYVPEGFTEIVAIESDTRTGGNVGLYVQNSVEQMSRSIGIHLAMNTQQPGQGRTRFAMLDQIRAALEI